MLVSAIFLLSVGAHSYAQRCYKKCKCDFATGSVICDQGGMTNNEMHEVYSMTSKNITSLVVTDGTHNHSRLNRFAIGWDLGDFRSLRRLVLTRGTMKTLGQNLLFQLSRLKELDVSHNHIRSVNSLTFSELSELEYLDLSHNRMVGILSYAFKYVKGLKTLMLQHNNISFIPSNGLIGLERLQHLNLARNPIGIELTEHMLRYSPDLRYLDLSGCQIKAIPNRFFEATPKISTLLLADNKLKTLPHMPLLILAKTLNQLDLAGNSISSMSPRLFTDWKLSNLNISKNPIGSQFDVSYESLHFSKIVALNLSETGLTQSKFSLLTTIAHQLQTLDISNNDIGEFNVMIISKFQNIRHLYVSHANISKLPLDLTNNFTSVQSLDLSHNQITSVSEQFLSYFPNLSVLDVSHCRISNDQNLLIFSKLCSVFLGGNRWHCECETHAFRDYLITRNHTLSDGCPNPRYDLVACHSPKKYEGMAIMQFTDRDIPACSPIFGAAWLSRNSEIGILIGGGVAILLIIFLTAAVACSYIWPKIEAKKHKLNRERTLERFAISFSDSPFELKDHGRGSCKTTGRSIDRAYWDFNIMDLYDSEKLC